MCWQHRCLSTVVGMLILSGASTVWAGVGPTAGESEPVTAARTVEVRATSVDFVGQLGLDFPSLASLGARIESAYQQADPVGLASAARELQIAEAVSEKSADVKAADLIKQAVELAQRRNQSQELKAVAAILDASVNAKDLLDQAARAAEGEKTAQHAKQTNENARGIQRSLHVDNRTRRTLYIYLDGRYVGSVSPWGDAYMYIGQGAWENTYLDARDGFGGRWHNVVGTPVGNFSWILRD